MSVSRWMVGLTVLAVAAFSIGCGGDDGKKDRGKSADRAVKEKERGKEEHVHEGPHHGAIADWGDEEYHAEFTIDHKASSVKVYILGPDVKKPAPIRADKVILSIKKPPFQVELKPERQKEDPEGTASVFVGKDDRFGIERDLEGTLSAEFGGKQYSGDFKEEANGHTHPHKK